MKVLSFEVDGEVYILGTPDYSIAEFDSTAEISQIFKMGLKPIDNEDPDFATRVAEAFSFVLKSDPRIQELNSLMDLVSENILPELAVAVLVALKEFDNFIVMSFFKGTEKAKEWHKGGKPYVFRSTTLQVHDGDFKSFRDLLKKSIPKAKDAYTSPRLSQMNLSAYKYIENTDTVH